MTLRRKFIIAFAAVAALVGVCVGGFTYFLTAHNLRGEMDRSLATAATALAAGVSAQTISGGADHQLPSDTTGDHQQGAIQGAVRISVNGTTHTLVGVSIPVTDAERRLLTSPAGSHVFQISTVDGTDYRVLAQTLDHGQGVLLVARDMSEIGRVLARLGTTTLGVSLIVVVVAAFAGALVARQITRRLSALTAAAETVSSTGDLGIAIPAKGKDEVGRLGASIRTMLAELDRSRHDQQRLVQDAGHELRTPLTSLRTNLAVLRRIEALPPDSRGRLLDDVEGETRELTSLVNELVQLAGGGASAEAASTVDLADLAERVAARFRRRSGRTITVSAAPTRRTVQPQSVERALSNLVDNAIKFDPTGTAPIEITVGPDRIQVADRGPGIDPADAAHIFDRFYRATAARSLPGSGLGLAIVADIASRHHGEPFARARVGGGAEIGFTFTDPAPLA